MILLYICEKKKMKVAMVEETMRMVFNVIAYINLAVCILDITFKHTICRRISYTEYWKKYSGVRLFIWLDIYIIVTMFIIYTTYNIVAGESYNSMLL